MSYIFGKNSQMTLWTSSCITSDSDIWCPGLFNYLLIIYLSIYLREEYLLWGACEEVRGQLAGSDSVLHWVPGMETGRMARLRSSVNPLAPSPAEMPQF